MTRSDRRLSGAAALVILLHLALVAIVESAMFESHLTRALGGVQPGRAARLAAPVGRTVALELSALVLSGFVAIRVLGSRRSRVDTARLVPIFLIAWSPVVLYSAGILLAIAGGWEPRIQIFSSREATDAEVADTIREALPIIMHPLTTGRHVANGASALLLAVLLYQVCGIDVKRSLAAAAAAGVIVTLAAILA